MSRLVSYLPLTSVVGDSALGQCFLYTSYYLYYSIRPVHSCMYCTYPDETSRIIARLGDLDC